MEERKNSGELQEHMLWTYYGLRVGLAAIAVAFPIVIAGAGAALHQASLAPSISAYYHTTPTFFWFTTRDIFVGGLLAVSACLYLYKGFSNKENIALNLAGIFALLVAFLPTSAPGEASGLVSKLHGTSAVLFFVCIAYVSLARSRDTLHLLPRPKREHYGRLYTSTGVAMIVSPAAAVFLSFRMNTLTFWVETLAVWSFAAYWIVKTLEMRESSAERRALDAELKRDIVPASAEITTGVGGAKTRPSPGVEGIVTATPPK